MVDYGKISTDIEQGEGVRHVAVCHHAITKLGKTYNTVITMVVITTLIITLIDCTANLIQQECYE